MKLSRSRPMRRRLVSAAVLLALGCNPTLPPTATPGPTPTLAPTATPVPSATQGSIASSSPSPLGLAWHDCELEFQCSTLEVPLDYHEPTGPTTTLALIRRQADIPSERVGSIVVNPGGPGGSGIGFVQGSWHVFGPELTNRFDIVGFDPRGIGQSDAVHCLDTRPALTAGVPDTAAEEAAYEELAQDVVAACVANSADLLPHVGTDNVARDLDRIRDALGEGRLNYIGFSYGTFIGALYADMFPTNIRAMVLDGPLDPTVDFATFIHDQSAASQDELDEFLDSCAPDPSCPFSAGDQTRANFEELMGQFEAAPIDGVTAPEAWAAIYGELVADDDEGLATILELARDGDVSLIRLAGGSARDARGLDGYEAVNCLDYAMPQDPEGMAAAAAEVERVAPDMGPTNVYTYFNCAYWPVGPTRTPGPVVGAGAPPILVIASTGDPATP
ncbi:MAG: hypothetical protein QOJ81_1377, partial [Chloroflexota bacterium]|nr:hypothetical protein [Chloroflexota bacterium]